MSIPKSLILYRAQRHRFSLPVNIKQGYYSDKISLTPSAPNKKQYVNFHLRYQTKFTQEISLNIYDNRGPKARAILSKISHVRKFKIEPVYQTVQEESIKWVTKEFRGVFRILKRIKKLVIDLSGKPQERARVPKALLLLPSLKSLTLPNFSYAEDSKSPKLFIDAIKSASKRKSWFCLKSLNIQLRPPILRASDPEQDNIFLRSLRKLLLEFMNNLKSYEKIYDCSSLEFQLSPTACIYLEQANLLTEIVKSAPLITSLKCCEASHFSTFPDLVQHSKNLKEISLQFRGNSQFDFNLSVLNGISTFQDLTLSGVFLEEKLFAQIKSLENLTALSLKFRNGLNASGSEARYLARIISDLKNLKSLELDFSSKNSIGRRKIKVESLAWFYEVFQAIGEKSNLEKLHLTFPTFDFEKPELAFQDLCQNIEKLANLSDFKLFVLHADTLEDKSMLRLDQCWSKLAKIQELSLRTSKDSCFSSSTYSTLVEGLVRSLPLLSSLGIMVGCTEMIDEDYLLLSKQFNKMRCLGYLTLFFQGGDLESELGLKGLGTEIRKRGIGDLSYYNINYNYALRF